MENADIAILPNQNDDSKTEKPKKEPHTEQNQVVSMGPAEDIEKPDSPYYKIGEPMQVDLSSQSEKGSTIFQYTVTDMKVYTNLSGIDTSNIQMKFYIDENGKQQRRKLSDYVDENGNLNDDYLYVVVDINTKYISGYDEVRDELYHGKLKYNYGPVSKKEIVTEGEDGTRYTSYVLLDENGEVYKEPEFIGSYASFYYEGAPKDSNHMYLKIGEEINWQGGKFFEKSLIEKYGAFFSLNSYTQVQLPIDLSKCE